MRARLVSAEDREDGTYATYESVQEHEGDLSFLPRTVGEAIKMIKSGAVIVDGERVTDWKNFVLAPGPHLVRIGSKDRKHVVIHVPEGATMGALPQN